MLRPWSSSAVRNYEIRHVISENGTNELSPVSILFNKAANERLDSIGFKKGPKKARKDPKGIFGKGKKVELLESGKKYI